ncbi:MAG TPA: flagellar hook-basal body complex protein FliE [Phycisphaerales bacterium]|nr:flagellar hook-basal body complex protein FliE [Phycisphaerales bacterium]
MINPMTNINPLAGPAGVPGSLAGKTGAPEAGDSQFSKAVGAVGKYLSHVDSLQTGSDVSIKELLAGKNEDINTVVAAVAKADMSFKLLVGVRNKLIEAYQKTMNMPI